MEPRGRLRDGERALMTITRNRHSGYWADLEARERAERDGPAQIERLVTAIERLERRFDEFAGAFLNAKFPYGKPTDRWPRQ